MPPNVMSSFIVRAVITEDDEQMHSQHRAGNTHTHTHNTQRHTQTRIHSFLSHTHAHTHTHTHTHSGVPQGIDQRKRTPCAAHTHTHKPTHTHQRVTTRIHPRH